MRLINIKTFRLEEFPDSSVPPYAILSHTWGPDSEELNFRDIEDGNIDKPGIGSLKFLGCCQKAAKDGLGYAWIDTCCIDKTNLVELSEAINSMFRWYQDAAICYVFLSDVSSDEDPQKAGSNFRKSRWFRRGWTLQELLAPKIIRFYGSITLSNTRRTQEIINGNVIHEWRPLGTKGSMSTTISSITSIPREYLLGVAQLHTASVAQRMSWAANRETKRKEDIAYCLLGIFNITMPMIYGEGGDQAFFRLQEQIMKVIGDDSILAWGFTNESSATKTSKATAGNIMAKAPLDFANSGHIIRRDQSLKYTRPVDISGGSIRAYLPLLITSTGQMAGLLSCGPENNAQQVVGIPLIELATGSPDEYVRPQGYSSSLYSTASLTIMPEQINIKHNSQETASVDSNRVYFHYEDKDFTDLNLKMIDVVPRSCWDEERALIISTANNDNRLNQILIRLRSKEPESKDFIIVLKYEEQNSETSAECLVFICDRNIVSEQLSMNLPSMMKTLDGKARAKNELLSLHIALERVKRQPIFVIRPKQVSGEVFATVNATMELNEDNLKQEYLQLLDKNELAKGENKEMKDNAYLCNNSRKVEREQENISVKITPYKATEQRHTVSAEEEKGCAEELSVITSKQATIGENLRNMPSPRSELRNADDSIVTLSGKTALQRAAAEGNVEEVRQLLEEGAGVNARDKDGWTPLLAASEHGHAKVARILIEKGADLEAKAKMGMTPLLMASTAGCFELVQLLLTKGAAVEAEDAEGLTPLIAASYVGNANIVWLLLEYGARIDAKTKGNLTALKIASMQGRNNVVKLLLSKGATDSEFGLLEAFDPMWRQHFRQYIKELPDDFIKKNQQYIVDFLKGKKAMLKINAALRLHSRDPLPTPPASP
ncbi:hypothetical protein GGI43DRAFT_196890 [Trichoderma evansii]